MNETVKPLLIELRRQLESLYGERLEQVILFGSQARGDAVEGSDIDVMIVLQGDVNVGDEISRTSQLCSDLSLAYDVALSRIFTSAERFAQGRSPLLLNVHREGVLV